MELLNAELGTERQPFFSLSPDPFGTLGTLGPPVKLVERLEDETGHTILGNELLEVFSLGVEGFPNGIVRRVGLVGLRPLGRTGGRGATYCTLVTHNDRMYEDDSQIRKFRPDPFHVGTKANFDVLKTSLLEGPELIVDIVDGVHTERGSSNAKSEVAKVVGHF